MNSASLERLEKRAYRLETLAEALRRDGARKEAAERATSAADLRSILAEREKLREALTNISIGTPLLATDERAWIDYVTDLARAALAPSVASETRTDETRDRREVGR